MNTESIIRPVIDLIIAEMDDDLLSNRASFGSPIEAKFYGVLSCYLHYYARHRISIPRATRPFEVSIEPQVDIGDYRVDFLVTAVSLHTHAQRMLVVECDGHDFHERTKEQARRDRRRDRAMQSAGYTVYRFTGSEIHNDVIRCVREVWQWIGVAESSAP